MKNRIRIFSPFFSLYGIAFCIFIALIQQGSLGALTPKDAFKAFFWTQDTDGGTKNGCYGYCQVDSVDTAANTFKHSTSFWVLDKGVFNFFKNIYGKTALEYYRSLPPAITRSPNHFSNVEWFTGFNRANSTDSIRFYFPLLPQSQKYGRYDYFTVDVDSLCDLEFYGAGDSIMVGTFVHKKPDERGAVNILGRNAFIVELTDANPLRIKSIRCKGTFDSLLTLYLGYNLNTFKKNAAWYGIDIIDTLSDAPKISVHSITVDGRSPYVTKTTHTIRWTLESSEAVERCSVFVSNDNKVSWRYEGSIQKADTLPWTILPGDTSKSAAIKVLACGKYGERIYSTSDTFTIKKEARFTLDIQSYAANKVVARWNPNALDTINKKAFCIAYQMGSIVNAITPATKVKKYPFTQVSDTIDNLNETGMYYFTAFIEESPGIYTKTAGDSIDSASAQDLTPPVNNYTLSTAAVDSSSITLSWRSSIPVNSDIDSIALWYNRTNIPNINSLEASTHIKTLKPGDDNYTVGNLSPDKLYYFALFAVDAHGNWSDAPDSAQLRVRTKPVETGVISGIADTLFPDDTMHLFSDSLLIFSSNIKTLYIDTIDRWEAPPLDGLIQAGPGFTFRSGTPPSESTIKFTITYREPSAPFTDHDILVYRLNTSTGDFIRDTAAIVRDTVKNSITIVSQKLTQPYILMIDTIAPTITEIRRDTSSIKVNQRIEGLFRLDDNTANPSLRLYAGPGATGYEDLKDYYFEPAKEPGTYRYIIPARDADDCSGLRGIIIANDGHNSDTINLSRRIIRATNNCDDNNTSPLEWTPIRVTATPEQTSMEAMIAEAFGEKTYRYDSTEARIIKWQPNDSNALSGSKWVELREGTGSDFPLTLGKLYWIKTRRKIPLSFGTATVPALIDTFSITLKKGEWTDFSLPYNFDIYTGDIIASTLQTTGLELYQWKKDSVTSRYRADNFYLAGSVGKENPLHILSAAGVYTARNSSNNDITLRIPPVTTHLSMLDTTHNNALSKQRTSPTQWEVAVTFSDDRYGLFASSLLMQKPPHGTSHWYSVAPSFSSTEAAIINPADGKKYGHTCSGDLSSGGEVYTLHYRNGSNSASILTVAVAKTSNLPAGTSAQLFQISNHTSDMSGNAYSTTIAPQQKGTGYLIIGSDAYIKNRLVALNSYFSFSPFTSGGALKINYSLPLDVKTVYITIFDLKGRRIAEHIKTTGLNAGKSSLTIGNTFTAGYYVVQMRIELSNHHELRTLNKRWMYVR